MIASNPRRTDSAAVRSISYVAAHVLPLNYAFFFFLFCCVFFFYNGKHIVSCICLHLIMSSQCVHWHACCVMLSVSPARVCMHVLTCVASRARCCAPVPHRWWSFSWPSPLSLLSCGFSYKAGWWGWGGAPAQTTWTAWVFLSRRSEPSTIQTVMDSLSFSPRICIAQGSNPE